MKLELKHLAPYLPYNLQVEYKGEITTIDALDSSGGVFVGKNRMVSFIDIKNVKPTLRPLSSMTEKELEELEDIIGCNFYIYVSGGKIEIEENTTDPYNGKSSLKMETLHRVYEWLFSHHFDVFGLIDRGLAIEKE